LARKITKNMSGFPGDLINVDKEDGGLGIRSLSDDANDRKCKLLLDLIDKDDQTGFAMRGIVGRGHRSAGRGGVRGTELIMGCSIGDSTWISSLVQWLKEMGLEDPIGTPTAEGLKLANELAYKAQRPEIIKIAQAMKEAEDAKSKK
jgi:hypothetical protein